jgi:hypothetical protein
MIPLITKFNSNSVLYDSLGESSISYISMYGNKEDIYFLKDTIGTTIKYDTTTEILSTIQINLPLSSVTGIVVNSIIKYKDDIYGFNGFDVKPFINQSVLYIQDNSKLVQESYDRKINVVLLSSSSQIRDFILDDDMNYYVIHNKNRISKFSKDRILQYTTTITAANSVFNQLLILPDNEIDILKIDIVREYTNNGLRSYPIILGRVQNEVQTIRSGELFLAKFDEIKKDVYYANLVGLTGEYIPYGNSKRMNYNLTNYDYLKNTYKNNNTLTFKAVLKNVYNNRNKEVVEIPIDITGFKTESHHFAFRVDGVDGTISVFCDGVEIKTVNIQKGKYIFQNLINDNISVGNTYFYNQNTLEKYLKQQNYYYINNSYIKQFKLYNKALTNNQIEFLLYKGIDMKDLVVSLPCDQRNELDGIERQFKLDSTGNKSNKINIIIKNSQITNSDLQKKLKSVIIDKLKKTLPITTTINNIEFRLSS